MSGTATATQGVHMHRLESDMDAAGVVDKDAEEDVDKNEQGEAREGGNLGEGD